MAINAVDVIFVARLGEAQLAASTLGIAAFALLVWSSTGLIALAPIASAELGRRKHAVREVRRTTRMALWLTVAIGLLLTIVFQFGEAIFRATGQPAELSIQAGQFLSVLAFAILPLLLAMTLRQFVSTLDRAVYASWINAIALATNILGNWTFVFGHLGFPRARACRIGALQCGHFVGHGGGLCRRGPVRPAAAALPDHGPLVAPGMAAAARNDPARRTHCRDDPRRSRAVRRRRVPDGPHRPG